MGLLKVLIIYSNRRRKMVNIRSLIKNSSAMKDQNWGRNCPHGTEEKEKSIVIFFR